MRSSPDAQMATRNDDATAVAPSSSSSAASTSSSPKEDYAAAGAARVEALNSCAQEKALYDACWNHWYRYHFIRGQLQQNCNHFFEEYRACVLEELEKKGLVDLAAKGFALDPANERRAEP
ncbi:hypothetical protein BESB_065760 [Besnoitia besnoiti]|uniref:Family UPF0203 protein n=1 Tax=Besnoitia besnoiti TaxID=94643 RepID=A0A2A9MFV4_BESBE|nr:hypothetical protein BESB_065760 [Besnoitia besnoiti]PFH34543.1 hypothetical protein BESB_065760 [Besnoitia besnoiti]